MLSYEPCRLHCSTLKLSRPVRVEMQTTSQGVCRQVPHSAITCDHHVCVLFGRWTVHHAAIGVFDPAHSSDSPGTAVAFQPPYIPRPSIGCSSATLEFHLTRGPDAGRKCAQSGRDVPPAPFAAHMTAAAAPELVRGRHVGAPCVCHNTKGLIRSAQARSRQRTASLRLLERAPRNRCSKKRSAIVDGQV